MSRRLSVFLGMMLLIAFVLLLQPHVRLAGARDGPWTRADADPRQEDTPAPSATPPTASSQTPSATQPTPMVTPDTGPHYLDLSIDPNPAHEWQLVTAHVRARDMGLDRVELGLRRLGCEEDCSVGYNVSCVRTGHLALAFLAPSIGVWEARASAFGEAYECHNGQCGWALVAWGSTERPVTLTVEGSTRYLPVLVRPEGSGYTPTPTSTVAATPTATVTPMRSPTPTATATVARSPTATDEPSIAVVSGRVALGEEGGPGLPGVRIELWMGSPQEVFITDEEGRYHSREMQLHNETLFLNPSKPGYFFEPPGATFRHYGWPGRSVYGIEFVALPGTPSPTPPTPTVAPVPPTDYVWAVAIDPATGDKWFGTHGGVGRLLPDGTWETFTTADGLASNAIRAIAIDPLTGDRWFATMDGASKLSEDGTWQTYLAQANVQDVAIDPATGDTWFALPGGRASRLATDGRWETFQIAASDTPWVADPWVKAIAIDPATGDTWFGLAYGDADCAGVRRLGVDGEWETFTSADGLVSQSVVAIAIDVSTGSKWFGTDSGVSTLGADGCWRTFTESDGLAGGGVRAVAIDPTTGSEWFATGFGVSALGVDGRWQTFTEFDGLASNWVDDVAVDGTTSDKWFGTAHGVSRLSADGHWQTFHVWRSTPVGNEIAGKPGVVRRSGDWRKRCGVYS